MGLFLASSAIRHRDVPEIAEHVSAYLAAFGVIATVGPSGSPDQRTDALFFRAPNDWTVIVWPAYFGADVDAATVLARQLETIVSTIHIYDGDYWAHSLLDRGQLIDRFCSTPDYFETAPDVRARLRREWAGDAARIGQVFGISADLVRPYIRYVDLARRDEPGRPDPGPLGRAFADDQSTLDDVWVFVDFWRRLGIEFPPDVAQFDLRIRLGDDFFDKLPSDDL